MKTPRDRAIDILWNFNGRPMSRSLFVLWCSDDRPLGRTQKKLLDAIEAGILEDRKQLEATRAPS